MSVALLIALIFLEKSGAHASALKNPIFLKSVLRNMILGENFIIFVKKLISTLFEVSGALFALIN